MKALSYRQRAANGAKLLDEHFPGWERTVNLSTLNIDSDSNCVLGQVFGGFSRGINSLQGAGVIPDGQYPGLFFAEHGFNFYGAEWQSEDTARNVNKWLVRRWTEEVNSRVAA